jgi:hypothetical protein
MQRQLEFVQEVVEREGRLPRQFAGLLVAPIDAVFDLLEETGVTLRRQAEALQAAGRALEDTAALMKRQAELFERTVTLLRQPTELAKAATGLERQPAKSEAGEPTAGARSKAAAPGETGTRSTPGGPSEAPEPRATRASGAPRRSSESRAASKTGSGTSGGTRGKTVPRTTGDGVRETGAQRKSSAPRRKPRAPRT